MTTTPRPPTSGFEQVRGTLTPLSLAQLDARAALLSRQDVKYLLPQATASTLMQSLSSRYEVLEVDGERAFTYDSTYVDSSDLRLYRDHAQGRRLRWKARTRRYGDGPLCFRELKLKGQRGATVKLRERCPTSEHGWAGPAMTAFVDAGLREHYGTGLMMPLVAALSVRYERTTLVSVDGRERLTLDRHLSVVDRDGRTTGGLRPGLVLLEVKTPRGRGRADLALAGLGVRPRSLSKYGIAVALSYPHVGHAALRPVLRAGFTSAAEQRAA